MKLTRPLNFAGRLYRVGDDISGQLPPDMIALLKTNGAITTGSDPSPSAGAKSMQPTVAQLKLLVAETENLEQLSELLRKEQESDNPRTSAIKLLEDRIAELEKSQAIGNIDDEDEDSEGDEDDGV